MTLWLLVPRDPLIFRDGKPFTAVPGERSRSLLFPYPATLAGAVRTRTGINPKNGEFDKDRVNELKQLSIRGPVLVALDNDGQIQDWFFPAPADALLVKDDMPVRYSLAPLEIPTNAFSDLDGKSLVGPVRHIKDKPLSRPPRYWKWEQIKAWLEEPVDGAIALDELGIQGPERETRTHVSIDLDTQTALTGALFQTSGMEFIQPKCENGGMQKKNAHLLALALETEANLLEGLDFLGGERRVVRWEKAEAALPTCPDSIKEEIIEQGQCRLALATPAYFIEGYLPSKLGSEQDVKVIVQAVALPRYQTISGWDYDKREPKPTRRLVPAGSVYFLKLKGNKDAIESFIDSVWLKPISDDDQSRADGFGLALFGTWDSSSRTMEVKP